jgi:hypothetical protein
MIRYALRCAGGHEFESWFQSSEAFEALADRNLLTCVECGGTEVSKALMAPRVGGEGGQAGDCPAPQTGSRGRAGKALGKLRDKLETESDWVGDRFVSEVRAIHGGDAPERPLWGKAAPDEARSLLEDGIPIAPVPFGPRKKMT